MFVENLYTNEEDKNFGNTIFDLWNLDYILDLTFELIEEETIDIDSIEELDIDQLHINGFATDRIARNLNEVLQWAKQLNKEIKSIKEK